MSELRDSNLDMFNESFYRADPADYLRTRLQLWASATTKPKDVAALASGIHVSGVQFPPLDIDANHDIDAFRTIDALNMRHHAAETVLRLFVAHAKRPSAPGTDLAERTNFAKFKQLVRDEILDTPPTAELVANVFLGSSSPGVEHNQEHLEHGSCQHDPVPARDGEGVPR